jgi:copper chaperone NosL
MQIGALKSKKTYRKHPLRFGIVSLLSMLLSANSDYGSIDRGWEYGYRSALQLQSHPSTRMRVTFSSKNHKERHYVSLEYLARDMPEIVFIPYTITVFDTKSQAWIDARKAFYVINSQKPCVLSRFCTYIFTTKKDAQAFISHYAGDIRSFEFALYVAQRDIPEDEKWLRKFRTMHHYPMGLKIMQTMCAKKINPNQYSSLRLLKIGIQQHALCATMPEYYLHSLALYAWEVMRHGTSINQSHIYVNTMPHMDIPHNAKCPVCGMFVSKYPQWAARITLSNGKHFYFDGVKDMLKFYFHPEKYHVKHSMHHAILTITDYYTLQSIDARKAFFVLGSTVLGPMGNELIPFQKKAHSKAFYKERKGHQLLLFSELTHAQIWKLDGVILP